METGGGTAREAAEARDREIDRRLGTETPALKALGGPEGELCDSEGWG